MKEKEGLEQVLFGDHDSEFYYQRQMLKKENNQKYLFHSFLSLVST